MSQRGGYVGELVVAQSYENLDDSIDVAVAAGDKYVQHFLNISVLSYFK